MAQAPAYKPQKRECVRLVGLEQVVTIACCSVCTVAAGVGNEVTELPWCLGDVFIPPPPDNPDVFVFDDSVTQGSAVVMVFVDDTTQGPNTTVMIF